ncbi:hypothetical protein Ssi03_75910 [Sphaerisporangium siamense]|nr:hypothetical protein Ssi03_75910 [Sphaerisporangium siamense]
MNPWTLTYDRFDPVEDAHRAPRRRQNRAGHQHEQAYQGDPHTGQADHEP